MTFEEWMKYNNYSLKGMDEHEAEFLMREAWDYQQAKIEALEHKLALRDAFIAVELIYPKVSITDDEGNVRLQTDDFGNVSIGTVQEGE
jgi:hypothetical protein